MVLTRDHSKTRLHIWGITLGTLLSSGVGAASSDNIQLRGFGSLSASYSDSDILGFRRDMTQEGHFRQWRTDQDSILGLQSDIQITDTLKASIQAVARDRATNEPEDTIEWANLNYNPNNTWNIRLGRIGSDLTLIGDVANIGYAYEWVRPPVEFYGAIPFYYFDGVEVLHRDRLADGYLSVKIFYGRSGSTFHYASGSNSEFDLSPFTGLSLRYEKGGLTFRATYTQTELQGIDNSTSAQLITQGRELINAAPVYSDSVGETIQHIDSEGSPIRYYTSGIEYRVSNWKVLAEAAYMHTDIDLLLPSFSAYTGIVRRFSNVAVYGLFSHIHTTNSTYQVSDAVPQPYRGYTQTLFNSVDLNQSTASFGTRWDIYPNVALKGQWDHSWVAADKAQLWKSSGTTPDEQVDTFTFSVNFIF